MKRIKTLERKRIGGNARLYNICSDFPVNLFICSIQRTRITMNLENKPCSELHIDTIRKELDLKMRSKKTFKNEGLRMPNGIFRTEKSFSMFWQLIEEPTVTDANVKPESPDERFKSLLRRHADPGQGEDFIERAFQQYKRIQKMLELERSQGEDFIESAFQEYKRIQKMLELKRSQVVSDISVDENLKDNKLNVVPGMDVAEKKSKVMEEPTVTDANVKPESPDESFKSLLRRHADPGQGEDFIERAFQEYKRIQKMLELKHSQVVSDIGLDEKLMDNKLNVVFDPVMDVARKKSKVVHDVHMDENRANKRKAVAESVMDENFNGVAYKSRKQ